MNGVEIAPRLVCKILGVYLDEQLRMKDHVNKAAAKATV